MDKRTERLLALIKQAQTQYSDHYFVIAVPGFLGKKFVGYCSMKEDLELLLEYIKVLRTKPSEVINSALSYSLISLYGKCFTDASKSNYPKLEANQLFEKESSHADTHAYLMQLRHQFIAHRGETESEVGISYILIPKNDSLDRSQVRFSQLKQISFTETDLERIEPLVKYLIDELLKKIQKNGQKVHDGILKLFTPEELTFMMMNNAK